MSSHKTKKLDSYWVMNNIGDKIYQYQLLSNIRFVQSTIHTLYTNTSRFISRVRIPLVLLHLSLFKPLITRCIPTLQVSCLDSVVVRAFDSKCLELSIPGSNPASAFDAGGYDGI